MEASESRSGRTCRTSSFYGLTNRYFNFDQILPLWSFHVNARRVSRLAVTAWWWQDVNHGLVRSNYNRRITRIKSQPCCHFTHRTRTWNVKPREPQNEPLDVSRPVEMSSLSFMFSVHVTERRLSLLTSCSQAAGVCLSLITGVFSGSLSRKGIFCDFFRKVFGKIF